MPNFSGIWSTAQQFQARGQNIWPKPPGAPTIGTATAGNSLCASVTFTAPGCTGYPTGVSSYTATSTPGCFTASGAASPLTVAGLTNGTSYTFKVKATGSGGLTGPCSAASNSITASNAGSQSYTTAGSYSWVAPAGVTSVSVVAVGGGAAGGRFYAGQGGSLGYKNNITVVPGNSYTVVVGKAGTSNACCAGAGAGDSYFCSTSVVKGGKGRGGQTAGSYTGDGGGLGGGVGASSSYGPAGGGGAGGYSGNGGAGGINTCAGSAGSGGGGGGGGAYSRTYNCCQSNGGGGGGGVGILGSGANGAGGTVGNGTANGGGGGSGGATGGSGCYTGYTSGAGGAYGGGGGKGNNAQYGAVGAVRIIWPGNTRSFPSTSAGNP